MLWMPDIMLYNSANPSFYSTYPSNVIVNHDGAMSQEHIHKQKLCKNTKK